MDSIAQRLSGAAGPGGTDSVSLQQWLLRFGDASAELRHIVGYFGDCMSNGRPTWVSYRALMSGCLVGLDKCPGLWSVGVGDTWQRMIAKCVVAATVEESKDACRIEQLCKWLEAKNEGGIHVV